MAYTDAAFTEAPSARTRRNCCFLVGVSREDTGSYLQYAGIWGIYWALPPVHSPRGPVTSGRREGQHPVCPVDLRITAQPFYYKRKMSAGGL